MYKFFALLTVLLLAPSLVLAGNARLDETYSAPVATDTLVRTGPAFVKFMTCSPTDNSSGAGTIQLRDAVAAGAGTIAVEWTVLAIDYTVSAPKIFPVMASFATGIYLDFTTTSDIKCWVSYVP